LGDFAHTFSSCINQFHVIVRPDTAYFSRRYFALRPDSAPHSSLLHKSLHLLVPFICVKPANSSVTLNSLLIPLCRTRRLSRLLLKKTTENYRLLFLTFFNVFLQSITFLFPTANLDKLFCAFFVTKCNICNRPSAIHLLIPRH
jgi:hypothetical protein